MLHERLQDNRVPWLLPWLLLLSRQRVTLPESRLRSTMFVRAILDYVAAAKFLLGGATGDFKAVLQARREYRKTKKNYAEARAENMTKTVCNDIKEHAPYSILWK